MTLIFACCHIRLDCTKCLDLVVVTDLSGGVETEYKMSVWFDQRMVYELSVRYVRTRVAAVTFSTNVGDKFYLNSYRSKEAITKAMNFHHKSGRTNTQEAYGLAKRCCVDLRFRPIARYKITPVLNIIKTLNARQASVEAVRVYNSHYWSNICILSMANQYSLI